MSMGVVFNILNAWMQGYWIFFVAFDEAHPAPFVRAGIDWFSTPQFIIGTILFFAICEKMIRIRSTIFPKEVYFVT